MKLRITLFTTLLVLLSACFTGCKKELKDFSFSYSMESVDNYYMDNFAKKRDPKIMEGTLTDEEFASLKPILQKCNFFKMKDSYGFEEETNRDLGDIMYQVSFTTEGKEKFISIRNSDTGQFSASFVKLIGFINTFLNNHKND